MSFRSALFFLLILISCRSAGAESFKIMAYNVRNYFLKGGRFGSMKEAYSKAALRDMVNSVAPDALVLTEVGDQAALDDFQKILNDGGADYDFAKVVDGPDSSRHIGLLSRRAPKEFIAVTDLLYRVKPKKKGASPVVNPVSRGFLHAVFELGDGYRLHVLGAHLKSKVFHYRFNQSDMRRYEARLLRYYADEILKKEPAANILVVGDLNDTPDSAPLRFLRAGKRGNKTGLLDIRPCDDMGMAWTHWWHEQDSYSRIDYALSSAGLVPELIFNDCRVCHLPDSWVYASDHRPLVVALETKDAEEWPDDKIVEIFPNGIKKEED